MMTSLKTCSLEDLKREPWRLQLQADNTAEQLRSLVVQNYHVFIQSNQCTAIVKNDLVELQKKSDAIEAAIPELQSQCATLQMDVTEIVAKHGDIQFVLEHYLQVKTSWIGQFYNPTIIALNKILTELLEIPQLLEACVHNELFDSALDVIQLVNETFQADYSAEATQNVVIDCLVREVTNMTSILREKLLQKLREDPQLALCVRIVSYLRRIDAFVEKDVGSVDYERKLKEEFLTCRNVWLLSLCQGLSCSDPYQYIIQLIDIKRTSWFDMITQYSAIFGSENLEHQVDVSLCRWATTTVAEFLNLLKTHLPKIDDFSSIATLFEQSLFFGGSLGRVGVDFQAVLLVSFEDHVLYLMTESWQAACRDFHDNLQMHALTSSTCVKTPIIVASSRSSAIASNSASARQELSKDDYSPPRSLLSFPLVAEFTNAVLSSLNELRQCAIVTLRTRMKKHYQSAIGTLLFTIAEFVTENGLNRIKCTSEENKTNQSSKQTVLAESIHAMNLILRLELLPYLMKCFHRLFPLVSSTCSLDVGEIIANEMKEFDESMRTAGLHVFSLPIARIEEKHEEGVTEVVLNNSLT
ncbi:hypothetical protein CCR75_006283 [Bremia lactucae]|uniref:Conserved oligomeric Golgi complex subunit 8 n=1 Tax=Bremia lactucae TaxID=4779 RepID=A0A976FF28_BRELC|nr:hypothetical protein CCR75_006283 [Bremia lactucae]